MDTKAKWLKTKNIDHPVSYKAMCFAIEAHGGQNRKYINTPYYLHLAEVAGLISTIYNDLEVIAVAWLHDVLEDTKITYNDLLVHFNPKIADGVLALSDLETGIRSERKLMSCKRLSMQEKWIQDIKICDLISNSPSIVLNDPKFAKIYLAEKRLLIESLTKADQRLLNIVHQKIS